MKKTLSILLSIILLCTMIPINTQAAKTFKMQCIQGETLEFSTWYEVTKATSSNPKVLKIKDKYHVVAKKAGTATLTFTFSNKTVYKYKVKVFSKKVIDKIDIERYDTPSGATIYSFTNNSGVDLDLKIKMVIHKNNGDDQADEVYIGTFPRKATYVYYAGEDVKITNFNYFYSSLRENGKLISLSENIKPQTEDAYFTVKNNKSKEVVYQYAILGYDENDNIVFIQPTNTTYIDANDTYRTNLPYDYVEKVDEDDCSYFELEVPVRFEIFSYCYYDEV